MLNYNEGSNARVTLYRVIQYMRDLLGAPIRYDRHYNGYYYVRDEGGAYELPGLWLNDSELHALLIIQQLLEDTQLDLLGRHLAPLRAHRKDPRKQTAGGGRDGTAGAHPLPRPQPRRRERAQGLAAAAHVLPRQPVPGRLVSPARRTALLSPGAHPRRLPLGRVCPRYPRRELDAHFAEVYGIFAGAPTATAVLRFTPERARWVAEERWHPAQQGQHLADGRYELCIPYADPR